MKTMSNWCFNRLTARGSRAKLRPFKRQARGSVDGKELLLSLGALVPEPAFPDDSRDGLKWRRAAWGTRCDLDSVQLNDCGDSLVFEFYTISTPPRPWLFQVAAMHEALEFELVYAEPEARFAGEFVCTDGVVTTSYHTVDARRYREFVRSRLPEDAGLLDE